MPSIWSASRDLIPAVQRAYDLSALLYEHVNRFPRAQHGLLGRIVLDDALQMLVLLAVANRRADKRETVVLEGAASAAPRPRGSAALHEDGGYAPPVASKGSGWLKHERAVAQRSSLEGAASAAPRPRGSAALHGDGGCASPVALKAGDGGCAEPVAPKRTGGVPCSMTSPTIERYLRIKLDHPNDIVFLTGAFCQTFFEDARRRLHVSNCACAPQSCNPRSTQPARTSSRMN